MTWGGKREGAGRKSSPLSPTVFVGVRLTEAERDYLRQRGKGNISEGIRRLIEERHQAAPGS